MALDAWKVAGRPSDWSEIWGVKYQQEAMEVLTEFLIVLDSLSEDLDSVCITSESRSGHE